MSSNDRITAKQEEVLRLVLMHKTSKEIGLILGISHYTVDKHIQTACRALRVENRRAAALMLVGNSPPEPLVTQSFGIEFPRVSDASAVSQPTHLATLTDSGEPTVRQPWNTRGFGSNSVGALQRFGEKTRRSVFIVMFSLLILIFGTLFVTVLTSLTEFVRQF